MKQLITRIENLNFRRKLFVLFGICLLLSLTTITATLTFYCSIQILGNNIQHLRETNKNEAADFGKRREELERRLFGILTMFQVPRAMAAVDSTQDMYEIHELQYHLNQLVSQSSPFDFALVETIGGIQVDTAEKLDARSDAVLQKARKFLSDYKDRACSESYVWLSDEENQVYVLHSIRSISNLNHLGFLLARVKSNVLFTSEQNSNCAAIYYTQDRACIYVPLSDDTLAETIRAYLQNGAVPEQYEVWNGERYFTQIDRASDGWRVLGITSLRVIWEVRSRAVLFGIIVGIITFLLGILAMSLMTRQLSLEIDSLSATISAISKGNIGLQTPVYSNDDIGRIAKQFNEMSRHNKTLMEELINSEKRKNQAEMEALDYKYRFLHTQINPHFIYNSLETINAIAKINMTPQVSRIVQLIGKYFHNITEYSEQQYISISDEFHSLQYFVDIYREIKGANLLVEMDCPFELENAKIPTMILQPILENAFLHGMRGADEISAVRVEVFRQGEILTIRIADNGMGSPASDITQDRRKRGAFSGIGLSNIRERLKLLYGDRAALHIHSCSNGTSVEITLPYS